MLQPKLKLGSGPGSGLRLGMPEGLARISLREGLRRLTENNILRQWVWGSITVFRVTRETLKNKGFLRAYIPPSGRLFLSLVP